MSATARREPSWWGAVTLEGQQAAYGRLGPLRLRFCKLKPHPKQEAFLRLQALQVFFGGAAGPGKSISMLIAALQYVDVPGYNAIILRRTFAELNLPGALIAVSQDLLAGTGAKWNQNLHQWTFPSGATLTFGFARAVSDLERYKGPEFQFIGWDELTSFPSEAFYRFLFSRLRRAAKPHLSSAPDGLRIERVPLRVRSASNPGGPGHTWVKSWFVNPITRNIDEETGERAVFMPARMTDNPSLDQAAYLRSLAHLPLVERLRLVNGDWDVQVGGVLFKRPFFDGHLVDGPAKDALRRVRYWDLAASEPTSSYPDPDYTVGLLLAVRPKGIVRVEHVKRGRWSPAGVDDAIETTARADSRRVPVRIEQEPGASGKSRIDLLARGLLLGYNVRGRPATRATRRDETRSAKFVRAEAVAAAAERGQVEVVAAPWTADFLDELEAFTGMEGPHDDQVDALSGAFTEVGARRGSTIAVPDGGDL